MSLKRIRIYSDTKRSDVIGISHELAQDGGAEKVAKVLSSLGYMVTNVGEMRGTRSREHLKVEPPIDDIGIVALSDCLGREVGIYDQRGVPIDQDVPLIRTDRLRQSVTSESAHQILAAA